MFYTFTAFNRRTNASNNLVVVSTLDWSQIYPEIKSHKSIITVKRFKACSNCNFITLHERRILLLSFKLIPCIHNTVHWLFDALRFNRTCARSAGFGSRVAHFHIVGMLRFMSDVNQPSLPTSFYSVLVTISVFMDMALSTVFHSINSLDNSPFSHSVLPILSLPYWSFQLYFFYENLFQP